MDNFTRHISYSACVLNWGRKNKIQQISNRSKKQLKGTVAMVQQLRKSITALALFLVPLLGFAQPAQAPLRLKADAPDRYVVVPGDTLWGISQRYTDSPWRWPELWGLNKDQIRNPHLIYPGYVILLDRASGRLSIGGPREANPPQAGKAAPPVQTAAARPGTARLEPKVRSEPLDKESIPSIPAAIIEPFLTRPLIVEPDGLDKAPTIVGTETDRVILATGNRAYVRGIGDTKEDTWYVYRRGAPLVDPDTDHTLAYEAIYLGTAQVMRNGEPATVVLTSAVQEVEAGDKLIAAATPRSLSYAPHAPSAQIRGRVMSVYGGVSKVGE